MKLDFKEMPETYLPICYQAEVKIGKFHFCTIQIIKHPLSEKFGNYNIELRHYDGLSSVEESFKPKYFLDILTGYKTKKEAFEAAEKECNKHLLDLFNELSKEEITTQ